MTTNIKEFAPYHTLQQTKSGFEVCYFDNNRKITPLLEAMPLDRACAALLEHEHMARNTGEQDYRLYFMTDKGFRHATEYDTWDGASAAFINLLNLYMMNEINLVSIRVDMNVGGDDFDELDLADLLAHYSLRKPDCDLAKLKALCDSSQAHPFF